MAFTTTKTTMMTMTMTTRRRMTISMMLMLVMLLALVAPLQAAASSLPRTTSLPSTTSVASSLADGEGDDVQRAPASAKVRYATKKLNSKCFEVTVRGQAMKNKRIELQYKVFKGKTARTRIENISGASLVNRAVDGRHVTFTLVPRKARFTATVCREKRTTKLPFQGAFMDLDCALKRCKGRASGRGFHGWFFNPQSWAPACGHKTAVENGEVAYYFTGYASLSRSLASAESFQTEPANGVKRWLTVGGANGIAGNEVCGTSDPGLWCKAMLAEYSTANQVKQLLSGSTIDFDGVLFDFEKSTADVTIAQTKRAMANVVRAGYKVAVTVSNCRPYGWEATAASKTQFAKAWGRDPNVSFYSPQMYGSGETYATIGNCQPADWGMLANFKAPIVPATPRLSDVEDYFNLGLEESGNPGAAATADIPAREAIAWHEC